MLVHAGAVLVVLLPVPLVAVLAELLLRQLRLEFHYMPQNGSSLRLIFASCSRGATSAAFRSFRPRWARACASGRSTESTWPGSLWRPSVAPSTASGPSA